MYKENKMKNTLKKKQVLFAKYYSSSSENNDPVHVFTDNDDSADEKCLYCNKPLKNDVLGGKWIHCIECGRWAYEMCVGINNCELSMFLIYLVIIVNNNYGAGAS